MQLKTFTRSTILIYACCLLLLFPFSSCDQIDNIEEELGEAIAVLDHGIYRIGSESQSWRMALEEIKFNLPEGLHNTKEEVAMLLNEALGATNSNIICVVDAIPKRVVRGLENMKAGLLGLNPRPVPPTICQTSMSIIDMNLPEFSRRKLVLNGYDFTEDEFLRLELHSLDANEPMIVTERLSKQSNYQYTINLADFDIDLMRYHSLKVIFNKELISEFSIIRTNDPEMFNVSFIPADLLNLCPDHIGGDDNFNGNGPNVSVAAEVFTVNEKEVWARISYHLIETESSWAEAQGEWQVQLYPSLAQDPPVGDYRIKRITSPKISTASYTDDDENVDLPMINGGLVSQFRCQAETSGQDIGECEGDDSTNLSITFNPIHLDVER